MVFVVNRFGQPLMPCSPRRARKLLDQKKAKVLTACPFKIRLLHGSSGYKQEVVAGLDTGSTVVGCAAVANGTVLYQSEVTLRNDITSKMDARRTYRRNRRNRKTRYRAARFNNRCASTRKGRLPPSIRSKIDSHLREARFVESILPVSHWKFELAAFDIHKITNPVVQGKGYQYGDLKGYYNLKQFILHRDNYKCQSKRKVEHSKNLHVHHIIFKSDGGPDTKENLIALCKRCHDDLHAGLYELANKGKRSATKHATEMGVIKARLAQCGIAHEPTFGYETKYKRERLRWSKTHANDAIAVCLEDGESVTPSETILVKKHIAGGDYQQTKGIRSQIAIPTGKMFGLRKGDKVSTSRGIGFVKGKRSTGYFSIADIEGQNIHASEKVTNCKRLTARTTTQIEELTISKLNKRRKTSAMLKAKEQVKKAAKQKTTTAAQPI